MNKIVTLKKCMLLLLTLTAGFSWAQPLSGNYTIGGISPDYPTIGSAAGAVQSFGVAGPVTFNIRDGIYAEKITMYQFAGSSAVNTVTFQSENGDSSLVVITDSSSATNLNNFTIQLFGADYVTFRQVSIQRPGNNAFGTVVEIGNNSNYISLLNNRITAGSGNGTSTSKCLIYTDSLAQNNGTIISGNLLVNGNFGVYKQSYTFETGNSITGNIFQNQAAGAVFADRQDGINISRNVISTTGGASYSGILLKRSLNGCTLNKNKIDITNGFAGIYFFTSTAFAGNENSATNNFVHVGGSQAGTGIFVNSSSQIRFYFNSVNMTGTNAMSAAFKAEGTGTTGLVSRNNIFAAHGGGYAIRVLPGVFITSDYNDLFTTGTNVGMFNAVDAASLVDWQNLSQKDTSSVSSDPVYYSAGDLHVSAVAINDAGIAAGGVGTDIDGDVRSATTPDIGADEFTPLTDNVKVVSLLLPEDYSCGDSSTFVSLVVQNIGINSASAIPVSVDITGTATLTFSGNMAGPLNSYELDTIILGGSWNTYAGGNYTLTCYTAMPGDQKLSDDTMILNRFLIGIPNNPLVTSPQVFCEGSVAITAQTDSGNVIYWYDSAFGGNLLYTGNPFMPALSSDTTFYLEAHSGTGTTGCLRITEIATESPTGNDHIEIQNCSAAPVNVTGWTVAVSNSYTVINDANTTIWDLGTFGTFAAGQTAVKNDNAASPDYWGSNLFWSSSNPGWAVILDNLGNVVDYLAWGWTTNDIQGFSTQINNFTVTASGSWNGDGVSDVCASPNAISRTGSSDHDDATDFTCMPSSSGTVNPGLMLPFVSCGTSACTSERIQVDVIINPTPAPDLGPDTISPVPITLDAGAGYASYLWSTTDTTQTINATATGTYAVMVTDANGCTGTDTILVTLTVSISELISLNGVMVFPNPVIDQLTITYYSRVIQEVSLTLSNSLGESIITKSFEAGIGREKTDLSLNGLPAGVYTLELKTAEGCLIRKVIVQ